MRDRIRNVAAIGITAFLVTIGATSLLAPQPIFTGITLRLDGSTLVVDSVDPSRAYLGIQPGSVVSDVNYAAIRDIPEKAMDAFLRGDFVEIGFPDGSGGVTQFTFPPSAAPPSGFVFLVGLALFIGIAIWVARGLAGERIRRLALPVAAASAAPLLMQVTTLSPMPLPLFIAVVTLPAVGQLLLADGFSEQVPQQHRRTLAYVTAVASAAVFGLVEVAITLLIRVEFTWVLSFFAVVLFAAITLGPAWILTSSARADRLPIVLAALTPPVIAIGYVSFNAGLGIPLIWLLIVVIVLQTNARVETLRIQRDTVVAATEMERARLAADLHDDALQEMTVLVRRLDEGGDARSAELARSVADRLREVCGELRLPILDELGAGPALEWLVGRVGEASGRPIRLERVDAGRPPANIELAVFRVAQEALANAVTHGAPPIVVRYDAAPDRASLSISDQGEGIASDAAKSATRAGHYGLLNMRQRAEQIGARIDFRRPPEGGTVVGMTWAPS